MKVDVTYHDLLNKILANGTTKSDRTGTGTISIFGEMVKFDLREGFPLMTTKKIHTKSVIYEDLWFVKGDTNIKYLVDNGVSIWNEWPYKGYIEFCDKALDQLNLEDEYLNKIMIKEDEKFRPYSMKEYIEKIKENVEIEKGLTFSQAFGELGPVYGAQWRAFGEVLEENQFGDVTTLIAGTDQIANIIERLKTNPDCRRLLVSAWNPNQIKYMALPPCHYSFQLYTEEMNLFERKKYWANSISKSVHYAEDYDDADLDLKGVPKRYISMIWNQRSVDVPLGLCFNIASYALLLMMIAQQVDMVPKILTGMLGDCHIYLNQIDGIKEQLRRDVNKYPSPTMVIKKAKDIFSYKFEDFELQNYESYPSIKMPVAV